MAYKTIKKSETVKFYRDHKSASTKYYIKIKNPGSDANLNIMKAVSHERTFDRDVIFCYNNRKVANKMFMIACLQFG